jgi:hypothetical protein
MFSDIVFYPIVAGAALFAFVQWMQTHGGFWLTALLLHVCYAVARIVRIYGSSPGITVIFDLAIVLLTVVMLIQANRQVLKDRAAAARRDIGKQAP